MKATHIALRILKVEEAIDNPHGTQRFVLLWVNEPDSILDFSEKSIAIISEHNVFDAVWKKELSIPILYIPGDFMLSSYSPHCQDPHRAFMASIAVTGSSKFRVFIPKLILDYEDEVRRYYDIDLFKHLIAYDCGNFIGFSEQPIDVDDLTFAEGTRARYISHPLTDDDIVMFWHTAEKIAELKQEKINIFSKLAVTL